MIRSAVTTCPRRDADYLPGTLDSLRAAGFDPYVCNDPALIGPYPAFLNALGLLCKRSEPEDMLIVFQDDLRCAKGLAGWLDWQFLPDGVLSLYCSTNQNVRPGWFPAEELPRFCPYGALGLAFPREIAVQLVANPIRGSNHGTENKVHSWCLRERVKLYLHSPSMLQHIGEVCTTGDPRGLIPDRVAGQWCEDVALLIPQCRASTPAASPCP